MKKGILIVAFIATAFIAGMSCNWFRSTAANPFLGKWKVDSVHTSDSSSIGGLLIATPFSDSVSLHLEFTKDSVYILAKGETKTSTYQVEEEKKEIRIGKESDLMIYRFSSDSVLHLSGTDSTLLILRKR